MDNDSPWAKTETWRLAQAERIKQWKPWERRWPKDRPVETIKPHEALAAALGLPFKP